LSTGLPENAAQDGGVDADVDRPGLDRRSLIKKAGIAGAAAWVAPMVLDSMLSPASAASLPPGDYQLRLSSGRCNPTPVLNPAGVGACLPPTWAAATLQIISDAQLASLGITVQNCHRRYAIEVDSPGPNITFTGAMSCRPPNRGGGPNPGVVAGDGSSVTWDSGVASDTNGYFITVHVT